MAKNKSVFGIYSSRSGVENAVTALKDAGFQHSDVSVLLPETLGNREVATEKNTKAPEGAATGAGSGAVIGGTLGLAGPGIGALAIPGLGDPVHRSRTNYGGVSWRRSWWRCWWSYGRSRRYGHPGIRSEAL